MKKNAHRPKTPKKTGEPSRKNERLSETVKKWAAFLVAHGATQREAAERIRAAGCKISQGSVSNAYRDYFNEDSPFPIPLLSTEELVENSRRLLHLYQQETFYQSSEDREWKDVGITQKNLYVPIWEYEKLSVEMTLKQEILSLERIMTEEDLSEEALEKLQARYDRLSEELKG